MFREDAQTWECHYRPSRGPPGFPVGVPSHQIRSGGCPDVGNVFAGHHVASLASWRALPPIKYFREDVWTWETSFPPITRPSWLSRERPFPSNTFGRMPRRGKRFCRPSRGLPGLRQALPPIKYFREDVQTWEIRPTAIPPLGYLPCHICGILPPSPFRKYRFIINI